MVLGKARSKKHRNPHKNQSIPVKQTSFRRKTGRLLGSFGGSGAAAVGGCQHLAAWDPGHPKESPPRQTRRACFLGARPGFSLGFIGNQQDYQQELFTFLEVQHRSTAKFFETHPATCTFAERRSPFTFPGVSRHMLCAEI